jgi:hypothetical protein
LATIPFLRRAVPYNSETEISFINNTSSGSYMPFTRIYLTSPSGGNYVLVRIYKNGILMETLSTPSISQNSNILIDENTGFFIGPGETQKITIVNLDSTGTAQDYEGQMIS